MKKVSKKGFTIAELLIVVAIIGVLVAIAIPVFRNRQEKAREAYDIYTMRQAASAAIDLYYMGIHDSASAAAAGLSWDSGGGKNGENAYGAYDPKTGRFLKDRKELSKIYKYGSGYGKGTAVNGGTEFIMGDPDGAYLANKDYTKAVILVSIYPNADHPRLVIYWKENKQSGADYIGGHIVNNVPTYCISIPLD